MNKVSALSRVSSFYIILLFGILSIGNLAGLQFHIEIITKVFAPEIGFYYFLFIIFGIVTFLNGMNLKNKREGHLFNMLVLAGSAVLETLVGYTYIGIIQTDLETSTILEFSDVRVIFYATVVSVFVYALGTIGLIIGKFLGQGE